MACKHSICGVCGGKKLHTKYIGIGTTLNEVCSGKCQAAQKNECSCKCNGKFHKGANERLLNSILNPKEKEVKKSTKVKAKKPIFQPVTMYDYLAEFLNGVRLKTSSFDRYSDRNYRKDNKKLTLFWLSPKGKNIDTLANDFISETGFTNYDESDIINAIVNYVNDYPSGIKKYIEDIEAERIREEEFYKGDYFADLYDNKPVIFGAMKLKKGSAAAKAYMAKIRAKKGTPKKVAGVLDTLKRKAIAAKKIGSVKKPIQTRHKDTKSHNVNIQVVSGFTNKINGLFDTSVLTDLDKLKKEYLKLANKYHPDKGGTTAQFQELEAEYRKYRDALIKGSSLNAEQKENEIQLDEALMQAINAISSLDGINIELAGKWLWVSGNTYPIRTELKAAGFMFASVKKMWYYKGTESAGRGNLSMEEIRNKYGSSKIQPKPQQKINGI